MEEKEEKKEADVEYHLNGGLVKYPDGKITKSNMFDIFQIPLDDYTACEKAWTQSDMRRIRMHGMKAKTGVQSVVPCHCLGPAKCPFRNRCPIVDRKIKTVDGEIDFYNQDINKFPLMAQCPHELEFVNFKMIQYAEEYDVDPESPTELGMISRLAVLDLYEYRLTLVMAHGDDKGEGMDLMKNQVTGTDLTGKKLTRKEIHPAWEIKEKIHKQREDILKSMVGTRREKYKKEAALKQRDSQDTSTTIADLRSKLTQLENQGDLDEVIDAEFKETEVK